MRPSPKGLCVHLSTKLTRVDIRIHWGLRVTSPVRTLLDVAPGLPGRRVTRLANDLRLAGQIKRRTWPTCSTAFLRHPGPGAPAAARAGSARPLRSRGCISAVHRRTVCPSRWTTPASPATRWTCTLGRAADRRLDGIDVPPPPRGAVEADRRKGSGCSPPPASRRSGHRRRLQNQAGTVPANLRASLAAPGADASVRRMRAHARQI